jgi:hypothetical protein
MYSRILFWLVFTSFAILLFWQGHYHLLGKGWFRPSLALQERVLHLGEVLPDTLVETELIVANIGIRPLIIEDVRSGCSGCIKVLSFPKAPIHRNEKVTLRFALNTDSLKGKVRKSMIIMSNDPIHPVTPVLIDADVKVQKQELPIGKGQQETCKFVLFVNLRTLRKPFAPLAVKREGI